jgi:hypothetical protein
LRVTSRGLGDVYKRQGLLETGLILKKKYQSLFRYEMNLKTSSK